MIVKVYAVKDVAAGAFGAPFFVQNDAMVKRVVKEAVNSDRENQFKQFVEDKQVYRIGEFDDATGLIKSHQPELLFNCIDLKEVKA